MFALFFFFRFSKVFDKLKVVLMPLGKESQQNVITKLRECKMFFLSFEMRLFKLQIF